MWSQIYSLVYYAIIIWYVSSCLPVLVSMEPFYVLMLTVMDQVRGKPLIPSYFLDSILSNFVVYHVYRLYTVQIQRRLGLGWSFTPPKFNSKMKFYFLRHPFCLNYFFTQHVKFLWKTKVKGRGEDRKLMIHIFLGFLAIPNQQSLIAENCKTLTCTVCSSELGTLLSFHPRSIPFPKSPRPNPHIM